MPQPEMNWLFCMQSEQRYLNFYGRRSEDNYSSTGVAHIAAMCNWRRFSLRRVFPRERSQMSWLHQFIQLLVPLFFAIEVSMTFCQCWNHKYDNSVKIIHLFFIINSWKFNRKVPSSSSSLFFVIWKPHLNMLPDSSGQNSGWLPVNSWIKTLFQEDN